MGNFSAIYLIVLLMACFWPLFVFVGSVHAAAVAGSAEPILYLFHA
jgi:hypothetical protein